MDAGSIALAALAVGVLIMFHEAGHFWAAKWSGMSVARFSVGFGPAIAKFERNGTVFQIGILPLGGFVQIDGMSPDDGSDPDAPTSYLNRPFHQRFATILAGPVANYLLAFFLVVVALVAFRFSYLPPVPVVSVAEGSPGAQAGLQVDDLIHGTEGRPFAQVPEFLKAIATSSGAAVRFDVERDGKRIIVPVTPEPVPGGYRIGVGYGMGDRLQRLDGLGLGEAMMRSADNMWTWTRGFVVGLASITSPSQVSGPIGIVQSLSEAVRRTGWGALPFIAQISVVLGVANMLPIPGLDGSRLLFLLVAAVRRKPVPPKLEATIHTIGVILLLLLLVAVSIKDVFM